MSENTRFKPSQQGIYSADILREKIYKPKQKVYFLLFSYSNPDTIKAFCGEILRSNDTLEDLGDQILRLGCQLEQP